MRINEITCATDKNGGLTIPEHILREMDIKPESNVKLAFFSDDISVNTYSEFLITPDGFIAMLDGSGQMVDGLEIPVELLEAAGIPSDSDISIAFEKGEMIIRAANVIELPADLLKTFTDLGVSPENIKITGDIVNEQEKTRV